MAPSGSGIIAPPDPTNRSLKGKRHEALEDCICAEYFAFSAALGVAAIGGLAVAAQASIAVISASHKGLSCFAVLLTAAFVTAAVPTNPQDLAGERHHRGVEPTVPHFRQW